MKIACFDLEGPLSPQDNAYEVASKLKNGKKLFEKISKYDDYLAEKNRHNHEPGDTLALIAPFLLSDEINEKDIKEISDKAKIVSGAKQLLNNLKKSGWDVYIISTSYQQHAHNIGEKLGVKKRKIYSTNLDLDELRKNLNTSFLDYIDEVKSKILETEYSPELINYLDKLFFEELPETEWGHPLKRVTVRGGKRKVKAVSEILGDENASLTDITVVGDSITDYKMLEEVKKENGNSIVFNGNKYAIPKAKFAAASLDIRVIKPIIKSNNPKKIVKSWERKQKNINENINQIPDSFKGFGLENIFKNRKTKKPILNYLENKSEKEIKEIIENHKFFRNHVRGEAAKLG